MCNLKGEQSPMETPEKSLNLWDDEFVQSMETPYYLTVLSLFLIFHYLYFVSTYYSALLILVAYHLSDYRNLKLFIYILQASEYRERVETLVKQVKILLKEVQGGDGDGDLIWRLQMVDALQCLGIDRYFQAEIKAALDFVYGSVKILFSLTIKIWIVKIRVCLKILSSH